MMKQQKTATELAELIAEHVGVDVWAIKVAADPAQGWTATLVPDLPIGVNAKAADIGPAVDRLRAVYDLAS